jgi:hypothetical protein
MVYTFTDSYTNISFLWCWRPHPVHDTYTPVCHIIDGRSLALQRFFCSNPILKPLKTVSLPSIFSKSKFKGRKDGTHHLFNVYIMDHTHHFHTDKSACSYIQISLLLMWIPCSSIKHRDHHQSKQGLMHSGNMSRSEVRQRYVWQYSTT